MSENEIIASIIQIGETKEENKNITTEDLGDLFKKSKKVHFIGLMNPPLEGLESCFMDFEQIYYQSKSHPDDYTVHLITWEEHTWIILSIPSTSGKLMKITARKNGLRLISGIPWIIKANKIIPLPIEFSQKNKKNTFVLERIPVMLLNPCREN